MQVTIPNLSVKVTYPDQGYHHQVTLKEVHSKQEEITIRTEACKAGNLITLIFFDFDLDHIETKQDGSTFYIFAYTEDHDCLDDPTHYQGLCERAVQWLKNYLRVHYPDLTTENTIVAFPAPAVREYNLKTGHEVSCTVLPPTKIKTLVSQC